MNGQTAEGRLKAMDILGEWGALEGMRIVVEQKMDISPLLYEMIRMTQNCGENECEKKIRAFLHRLEKARNSAVY